MFRSVLLGALISAILFEVSKHAFAFYLTRFATYDVVFGPLGAFVAFMIWIFLGALVMLFGAEVASEHEKLKVGSLS